MTSQRPEIRNNATDSLPGMAGYPNGPRSELPAFFEMRRPDGRQERPAKPRGFFG